MIIFIIIFIYLIFNIFSYMTTEHISTYEVEQGTMAENNIDRGHRNKRQRRGGGTDHRIKRDCCAGRNVPPVGRDQFSEEMSSPKYFSLSSLRVWDLHLLLVL